MLASGTSVRPVLQHDSLVRAFRSAAVPASGLLRSAGGGARQPANQSVALSRVDLHERCDLPGMNRGVAGALVTGR
jgi:hypothetical protein